jgi:hypothetical protein
MLDMDVIFEKCMHFFVVVLSQIYGNKLSNYGALGLAALRSYETKKQKKK